jgi:hypothetical protein
MRGNEKKLEFSRRILLQSGSAAVLVSTFGSSFNLAERTSGSMNVHRGSAKAAQETAVPLENAKLYGNELIKTPIGEVKLVNNYFNDDASSLLYDELDYQRAAQAYIWSTPLVSMTTWRNQEGKAFGVQGPNDFVVLRSLKEKRGIVTGNLTTPYIFNFSNLKDGPLVVEYPAGKTAGGILDFWQRPLADLGLTGPDAGNGGKYIVVGPEDDPKKYQEKKAFVFQSVTNNVGVLLRILDTDPAYYQKFKESIKMSQFGKPLQSCRFIEGKDVEWSATAPRSLDYWQTLSAIINEEPVREIDKAWMAMIEPLGIEKGKPFNPDARQRTILLRGGAMGELMARNFQVNPRFAEPYWKGTHWYKSFDFGVEQETSTMLQLDQRTTWFYEAVGSSKGMVNPTPGAGQVYMTTKRDSQGNMLRADRTYRLHVPKDVPVGQFWSLTLYSENTRRAYDNGGTEIRSASLDSRMQDLKRNADGSVDLYVGAKAPAGYESNLMKTVDADGWFVYFRLYAPLQPFFDKTFTLPDFEAVS